MLLLTGKKNIVVVPLEKWSWVKKKGDTKVWGGGDVKRSANRGKAKKGSHCYQGSEEGTKKKKKTIGGGGKKEEPSTGGGREFHQWGGGHPGGRHDRGGGQRGKNAVRSKIVR